MQKRSLSAVAVLSAAVLATAIALVVPSYTHSASQATVLGNANVKLLARAHTQADQLPASFLQSPAATHVNVAHARLASLDGNNAIYVAPGSSAGTICLIVYDRLAAAFSSSCAAHSLLTTGSVYLSWPRTDGTERVIGIVGDGHASAQSNGKTVKVVNNVFALANAKDAAITLTGSDGQHQNLNLGPQFPQNK